MQPAHKHCTFPPCAHRRCIHTHTCVRVCTQTSKLGVAMKGSTPEVPEVLPNAADLLLWVRTFVLAVAREAEAALELGGSGMTKELAMKLRDAAMMVFVYSPMGRWGWHVLSTATAAALAAMCAPHTASHAHNHRHPLVAADRRHAAHERVDLHQVPGVRRHPLQLQAVHRARLHGQQVCARARVCVCVCVRARVHALRFTALCIHTSPQGC